MGIPHWDELSSVFSLQLKQVSLVNIFLFLVILMCSLFPYDPYSEKNQIHGQNKNNTVILI